MDDADLVKALQERAARALPAVRMERLGGWWLRHSPGCAWWVGTVLPHGDIPPGDLERRVDQVEKFYADLGVPARFQISPPACPEGLDPILAARGYRQESAMSLQIGPTAQVLAQSTAQVQAQLPSITGELQVRVDDRPARPWYDVWHAVHGRHAADPQAEWDMLGRVVQPSAYATARLGNDVVAVGRAVADTGWVGVFGMATLPSARGKGAARSVLAALAGWAETRAAGRMYLQVERDNPPALRLYERSGFGELCAYHYRTAT